VVLSGVGLAALWWGVTSGNTLIAIVGAGWAALQWLAFWPGLAVRGKYETGQAAPAVVRKMISLGEMKVRGEIVAAVRLWLEVRPDGQPVYQTERNVILRRPSLERLSTGSTIEVRCHPSKQEAIPVAPLKLMD
jgi:hypothetical protein